MQLGTFSVSLTVTNLEVSIDFYKKLGFKKFTGGKDWVIMKHGNATIGLFQAVFEKNILTFNPGWTKNATPLRKFTDIRTIEKSLIRKGISLMKGTTTKKGPDSITFEDPDGNVILIDQHV